MAQLRIRTTVALVIVVVIVGSAAAHACPAPSPAALTFHQMIRRHTTGDSDFPVMILGKVVIVKDLGGGPRGKAIAKLAVAAHPTGFAPLVSRVQFYRPKPSDPAAGYYQRFHVGHLYVVIAARREEGGFDMVDICGPSREVNTQRFWDLVRLARRS